MVESAAHRAPGITNRLTIMVIPVAALAGTTAVLYSLVGFFLVFAGAGALVSVVLVGRGNLLGFALLGCSALIAFPAFLPRPIVGRENAAYGGSIDDRALIQLVVVVGILGAGLWFWLVSDAGIRVIAQQPLSTLSVYALLIGISFLYVPNLSWSVFGFLKLASILVLLLVLQGIVRTARQLKSVIDIMMGAIVVVLLVYWIDVARGAADSNLGRVEVSWIHPNSVTLLAVITCLVLVGRFVATRTLSHPYLTIGAGGFSAITAMVAGSKSSLGAGALSLLLVMLAVSLRTPGGFAFGRIALLVAGMASVIGYFVVTNAGVVAHLNAYSTEQHVNPADLTGRIPVWASAISDGTSSLQTSLLGHGYLSTFELGIQGRYWVAHQAHNSFVQTFFDLGLLGVAVVLVLFVTTWFNLLRVVACTATRKVSWVRAIELLGAFSALTIVSFTEDIVGGVVESRSFVFLIVVFCIFRNAMIGVEESDSPLPVHSDGAPERGVSDLRSNSLADRALTVS